MAARASFVAELKRRNVVRAVLLYAGAVWALSQGVSQLSPALGLPGSATRWFLIGCAGGFPLWAAFAWFYELTPHGFRRDAEIAADAPLRHANARTLDFGIMAALAVAVVLLGSGYFIRRRAPAAAAAWSATLPAGTAAFDPPPDSMVVLPFRDLNGGAGQQYFSDGITEELTDALGQNPGLRVIAWDTASHYRGGTDTPAAIGRALNVATILHGSIERQRDTLRVIAELVDTRTGRQLWSARYDDSLANVFQVQDRISAAIAGALKVRFARLAPAPRVNPRAHDLVLKARALVQTARTAAPFEQARDLYEQAIALDPGYADAHAGLAHTWFDLTQYSTLALKDALPIERREASKALALDPRNVDALVVLANADQAQGDIAGAEAESRRALALDPSSAVAHLDYGNMLPLGQAVAQEREAVQLDPRNATAQSNLADYSLDFGEYAQALAPALAAMKLAPHSADNAMALALNYALLHRGEDAVKAFDLARPDTPLATAVVAAGRLTYQSVLDPTLHDQALAAVGALGRRSDLDPDSMGDVIQLYLALGRNNTALDLLPKMCAATPVGCNDLSVNPLWIPLRGDPRFEALVQRYDTISRPAAAAATPAATSP